MKTRAFFTIEYIAETSDEPEIEPAVIEFDTFSIEQHRPVYSERDLDGHTIRLVPDPTTTTVIRGIQTEARS
jgi:hypothetical protein